MYEILPLTDAEKQQLNVARQELNFIGKKKHFHNWPQERVYYIQELMLRDWYHRKFVEKHYPRNELKVRNKPNINLKEIPKYEGKFDLKEFLNQGNEIKNVG